MNSILISKDYYRVTHISIVVFSELLTKNVLRMKRNPKTSELEEFSSPIKKGDDFKKVFATLLQKLFNIEIIPSLVSPPLKKIISLSQKTACLVWVVCIEPRFYSKTLKNTEEVSLKEFMETDKLKSPVYELKEKIFQLIQEKSEPF